MTRRFLCSVAVAVMTSAACGGGTVLDRHDAAGQGASGGFVGSGGVVGSGGSGGVGGSGGAGGSTSFVRRIEQPLSRDVDILFLIDDSSEMIPAQSKLRAALPSFVSALQGLPGGLPGLHVAVISTDMGAGDGSISTCTATSPSSYSGKNGLFQYGGGIIPPASTRCATHLQAGAKYVSNVGGVANYTGALEDVLGCLTALGDLGCGFESPFAAITRALGVDGLAPPADNAEFLRRDAALAIILLTNEDDCSTLPQIPLYDTTANTNIASQLGPLTNFRCNEFGHMCTRGVMPQAHPDRRAPGNNVAATVSYDSCDSNDIEGYELSARDTAYRLKMLKDDPSRIVVASIQGPALPYVVHWKMPPVAADTSCGAASCPWPEITHACTGADGSWGDPGVRTQVMTTQFGSNGLVSPICADSYAPALQQAATAIGQLFVPPCLRSTIVDDPSKPGLQPNCTVTGHVPQANGSTTDEPVPACADTAGVGPCWTATRQEPTCSGGVAFQFTPDPAAPAAITSLTIQCPVCTTGVNDPTECY